MRHRSTDELPEFDMRQLLLFDELVQRYQSQMGRAATRRRAADEMPLVFDSPAMEAAARRDDPLLPSFLAQQRSWVVRRSDWVQRKQLFTGPVRAVHMTEAEQLA